MKIKEEEQAMSVKETAVIREMIQTRGKRRECSAKEGSMIVQARGREKI